MHVNKPIVISVVTITVLGIWNAWSHKRVVSRVVLGGYILLFVLALVDMFGPPLSTIASGLAMVATTYMVLSFVPWDTIIKVLTGKNPIVENKITQTGKGE